MENFQCTGDGWTGYNGEAGEDGRIRVTVRVTKEEKLHVSHFVLTHAVKMQGRCGLQAFPISPYFLPQFLLDVLTTVIVS